MGDPLAARKGILIAVSLLGGFGKRGCERAYEGTWNDAVATGYFLFPVVSNFVMYFSLHFLFFRTCFLILECVFITSSSVFSVVFLICFFGPQLSPLPGSLFCFLILRRIGKNEA